MVKCYRCYWDSENVEICDRCGSDLLAQKTEEERLHKIAEKAYHPPKRRFARRIFLFLIAAACCISIVPIQNSAQKIGEQNALITIVALLSIMVLSIIFAMIPSKKG